MALYSCCDLPFPLLLLTALLVFVLVALITGVRRDILASRASQSLGTESTPERIGLGVVVPLVLAVAFIIGVEIVAFRFWDYLVTTGAP